MVEDPVVIETWLPAGTRGKTDRGPNLRGFLRPWTQGQEPYFSVAIIAPMADRVDSAPRFKFGPSRVRPS